MVCLEKMLMFLGILGKNDDFRWESEIPGEINGDFPVENGDF